MSSIGLKEVSHLAGVSVSTVSHILSGRTTRYSQKTRQLVIDAARQLDYRPDPISQALRTRKSSTIGVVMHGISDSVKLVEDIASQRGYQMLLAFTKWKTASDVVEIRNLLRRKVDGLLLLSPAVDSSHNEAVEELIEAKFPLVGIGISIAQNMDYVDWDRHAAYKKLTEHLLGRGCRRFLFLNVGETPAVLERIRGIQSALDAVPGTEFATMTSPSNELIPGQIADIITSGWPQAIICQSDLLALAAIKTATSAGIKLPDNLAVTGCSDMSFSALLHVPLTTIRMPAGKIVELAMERLFSRIENRDVQPEHFSAILQSEIIFRESDKYVAANNG